MKNPLVTTTFQKGTRESIEAFVEFIERTQGQLVSGTGILPVRTGSAGVSPASPRDSSIRSLAVQTVVAENEPHRQDARAATAFTLARWADNFLNEANYFAELKRLDKDPEVAEGRIRSLRELMTTMDGIGNEPAERLENFLENVTLDSDREEEKENTSDAVTLITMHSCKGLEFPHVFIVGLEDGLLPHTRSKAEGTMDEERRLFYVAVTRAMQTLAISHCGGRKKYGQLLPCHPSPFLKELPEELVEHSDAKSKIPVTQESGKDFFAAMRAAIS
jgi:superfamily I DNA/RNA helicase